MDHSDCADESKYLILKLELDPNLNACAVSHRSLYDEGCKRFFRWLSTGTQQSPANIQGAAGIDLKAVKQVPGILGRSKVWTYTTGEDEAQVPRSQHPRPLDSLELSDVSMGDPGFEALVDWLESIRAERNPQCRLTHLRLRCNDIKGHSALARAFVGALSYSPSAKVVSSSLSTLILSNNPLSHDFKQTLFQLLPQIPSLANLHLTMTGLTTDDALVLAAYIASQERRCKLVELHANQNQMGYTGVHAVVKAMQQCWTMEKVEMYANEADSDPASNVQVQENDEDWAPLKHQDFQTTFQAAITSFAIGSGCGWPALQQKMKQILARNVFLKRQTEREALKLLKYSRLMLQSKLPVSAPSTASQSRRDREHQPKHTSDFPSDVPQAPTSPYYFNDLPMEIQLSILAQLAPLLTSSQLIRIFEFAVNRDTLPSLRLSLPSFSSTQQNCIPDPESLLFDIAPPRNGVSTRGKKVGSLAAQGPGGNNQSSTVRNIHACGSGSCMGNKSVLCKRKTDRQKWLELVGCDSYDPQ